MEGARPRHVLLTGAPGCGKTTVMIGAVRLLQAAGRQVFGFWTEEMRQGGVRRGFAIELVSGVRGVLASVDRPGPPRVGKYGVNIQAMDRLAAPEVERAVAAARNTPGVIVAMDEIGKMELFSRSFQRAVLSAFDSPARVLATITARPHPFADGLKQRGDTRLVTVTQGTREGLPQEIAAWLLRD